MSSPIQVFSASILSVLNHLKKDRKGKEGEGEGEGERRKETKPSICFKSKTFQKLLLHFLVIDHSEVF